MRATIIVMLLLASLSCYLAFNTDMVDVASEEKTFENFEPVDIESGHFEWNNEVKR
jgi:hypothetical protein